MLDAIFAAMEWWAGPEIGSIALPDFMVSGDAVVLLGFRLE
jgi:hypothetical protein